MSGGRVSKAEGNGGAAQPVDVLSFDDFFDAVEAALVADDEGEVELTALREAIGRDAWTPEARRALLRPAHDEICALAGMMPAGTCLLWWRELVPAIERFVVIPPDLKDERDALAVTGASREQIEVVLRLIGAAKRCGVDLTYREDGPIEGVLGDPRLKLRPGRKAKQDVRMGATVLRDWLEWIEQTEERERVAADADEAVRFAAKAGVKATVAAKRKAKTIIAKWDVQRGGRAAQATMTLTSKFKHVSEWERTPVAMHSPGTKDHLHTAPFKVATYLPGGVGSDHRTLHAAIALLWLATGEGRFRPGDDRHEAYVKQLTRHKDEHKTSIADGAERYRQAVAHIDDAQNRLKTIR